MLFRKLPYILPLLFMQGCNKIDERPTPCTDAWYQAVETLIVTEDGQGHGPDIGSGEWRRVIENHLGLTSSDKIPDQHSKEWCQYIDDKLPK